MYVQLTKTAMSATSVYYTYIAYFQWLSAIGRKGTPFPHLQFLAAFLHLKFLKMH